MYAYVKHVPVELTLSSRINLPVGNLESRFFMRPLIFKDEMNSYDWPYTIDVQIAEELKFLNLLHHKHSGTTRFYTSMLCLYFPSMKPILCRHSIRANYALE